MPAIPSDDNMEAANCACFYTLFSCELLAQMVHLMSEPQVIFLGSGCNLSLTSTLGHETDYTGVHQNMEKLFKER